LERNRNLGVFFPKKHIFLRFFQKNVFFYLTFTKKSLKIKSEDMESSVIKL